MLSTKVHIIILLILSQSIGMAQSTDSTLMKLHQTKILIDSTQESLTTMTINGQVVSAYIADGDTIIIADIDDVKISSPRKFESSEDYLKYIKYRRYAAKVYPYAVEAIRIFEEAQVASSTLKKRKRKKFLKELSKELSEEFEEPLKRLSKTQGKILVEMIERELGTSIFELIKLTRGKFKAFYWNQSSKLYGYRLKEVYTVGQNPILDVVLQDFDISYQHNNKD